MFNRRFKFKGRGLGPFLLSLALLAVPWVVMSCPLKALANEKGVLRMATTTSTEATGLLDYLAKEFAKDTGIELQWVAVGTGKALEYGRRGDVDVVWVHDPKMEDEFLQQGFGVRRYRTMYNDFVLVGPQEDPARVRSASGASDAMARIASSGAVFVSRGDRSGTHMAEMRLWKAAGISPSREDRWYMESGQGMMETLVMANEKRGYTLTDRATFAKFLSNSPGGLVVLLQGGEELRNQYSVIAVNPAKNPSVRYNLASAFIRWITSERGQHLIGSYRIGGQKIFFPNATTTPLTEK